ncbi:sulfate adenylyltransferase subunit CysN [bacterium]|nr:sulfate adenylyltransferase subunit CysN [bacterium]
MLPVATSAARAEAQTQPGAGAPALSVAASLARELAAAELGVLRFITCGSVDDGKSTLIGRLLYDTKLIFEDQLAALEADSARHGTQGGAIDFALLLDGLEAEREQGITIDVAYRFFATDKRKFIVADTPGHEQYTRNMATGASTADVAVILIDARKGVLTQTRRHAYISHLLGVRSVVLAVNKMDLIGHDEAKFREIVASFGDFARGLAFDEVAAIPMSALNGDNVTRRSEVMDWYRGPHLLQHLETVDARRGRVDKTQAGATDAPFRLPVQWVNRPDQSFRGYAGTIASGSISVGDEVVVARSGRMSRVMSIVTADGDLPGASAGDAVTLLVADEIDASRGDVFSRPDARPMVSPRISAHVLWMNEEPLQPGRTYLMKCGAQLVQAVASRIAHRVDVNTMAREEASALALNEVGLCWFNLNQPLAFDTYAANRETGAFILIDRFSNQTVAAGMIEASLMEATNVHTQAMSVDKAARSRLKGHKPAVLWFTGLSGAGKSTIANLVERRLYDLGVHTHSLDGDNVRQGLNSDLGFSDAERVENIRRVGEVAKLFVDAGLIVTCSFISPFQAERDAVRGLLAPGEFIEVFVDVPLAVAEARDPKGLYKRARAGDIRNFTGVDSPYEPPAAPDLRLDASTATAEALAARVIAHLRDAGLIETQLSEALDWSI